MINKNIKEISGYRTEQVFIRGAEHIPPHPSQIKQAMMYFVYNYNHTEYDNIFEKMAANHIEFERIHPFGDGNGRTGRLLLNYELLRNNMAPVVIEKDLRADYFKKLAEYDVKGLELLKEKSNCELQRMQNFDVMLEDMSSVQKKKRGR